MAYKILSLDGGGSWALIQARVLQDIYGDIGGHELLRLFDMAIANSGGSLVLACLCNNMKLSEIVEVFKNDDKRSLVFPPIGINFGSILEPIIRLFIKGPRYKTEEKIKGIKKVLYQYDQQNSGNYIVDRFLDEIPAIIGENYNKNSLDLIICGFDYFRERVSFFRSNKVSKTDKFNSDTFYHISLADAIHASSNAPVRYFENPATVNLKLEKVDGNFDERKGWFWDGAVSGFNNPVLAGLIEALTNGYAAIDNDYRILSLGTSLTRKAILTDAEFSSDPNVREIWQKNKGKPYVVADSSFHYINDVAKLSKSILSDPPDSATFIAYSILHPDLKKDNPKLVRINPCLSPILKGNEYFAPDVYKDHENKFNELIEMDMDATHDDQIFLINDLCEKFIVNSKKPEDSLPNQLVRGNPQTGNGYLGYPTYYEAKQRWNELM